MIERKSKGVSGKEIIEFIPENEEDLSRLKFLSESGEIDSRQSFRDISVESVERELVSVQEVGGAQRKLPVATEVLYSSSTLNSFESLSLHQKTRLISVLDDWSRQVRSHETKIRRGELLLFRFPHEADLEPALLVARWTQESFFSRLLAGWHRREQLIIECCQVLGMPKRTADGFRGGTLHERNSWSISDNTRVLVIDIDSAPIQRDGQLEIARFQSRAIHTVVGHLESYIIEFLRNQFA